MKFGLLINLKLLTRENSFLLNILSMKISLLINMKMQNIVGIFIFISGENFILINIHEKFSAYKYENANYCWHFHNY